MTAFVSWPMTSADVAGSARNNRGKRAAVIVGFLRSVCPLIIRVVAACVNHLAVINRQDAQRILPNDEKTRSKSLFLESRAFVSSRRDAFSSRNAGCARGAREESPRLSRYGRTRRSQPLG